MRAEPRDTRVLSGEWWRFSAYEVVGRRICPARGARLERYDPWERVQGPRSGEAPHVELATLGEKIGKWYWEQVKASVARFKETVVVPREPTLADLRAYISEARVALAGGDSEAAELPEEISRLLVEWCARYGLLGIFQQETLAVNLQARPEALLDLLDELAEDDLLARYVRYERCGSTWRKRALVQRSQVAKGSYPQLPRRRLEELARTSAWPLDESRLAPATVLRRTLPAKQGPPSALDLAALTEAKGAYLGDRRGGSFPAPNSDEFWRAYGEDVVEFARYAVTLSEALTGVRQKSAKQRAFHLARLNELLGPVSLELMEETRPRARFASPSLIATLATMAFFDISGGVRFAHCERFGCARLFATTRTERRFCSPACQETAKRRRRYEDDAAHRSREQAAARERMRIRRARSTEGQRVG